MALQGNDELGRFIRSNLRSLGVSTDFIASEKDFSSKQFLYSDLYSMPHPGVVFHLLI